MSDPVPLNRPARFTCTKHGDTNQVIGLDGLPYCTPCLVELIAVAQLAPAVRKPEHIK